jgi:hypothetical protein
MVMLVTMGNAGNVNKTNGSMWCHVPDEAIVPWHIIHSIGGSDRQIDLRGSQRELCKCGFLVMSTVEKHGWLEEVLEGGRMCQEVQEDIHKVV